MDGRDDVALCNAARAHGKEPMKNRSAILAALLAFVLMAAGASLAWAGASAGAGAGAGAKTGKDNSSSAPSAGAGSAQDENLHLEGEKRFRSNCARCHAAPPRFAPRMMSTIVRHMRVRATITDEDMRLILRYMTE